MKANQKPAAHDRPEIVRARIEEFLRACRAPGVFEPGEKTVPLDPERFELQVRSSGIVLHIWNEQTSLVRRVIRVREEQRGKLALVTQRLGHGEGELLIVDLERAGPHLERQAGRLEFRERFRRMLARQFGDWTITQISAAADLEHSLSPAYSRALLSQGRAAFAAIGVDAESVPAACDQILSFGLIWLDYLRRRERRRTVSGLKLFLPHGRTAATGNRLAFLDPALASWELYEFSDDGGVSRVDESNYGNLTTALDPALPVAEPAGAVAEWVERLAEQFGAEQVARADGMVSLRLRGLEFARASARVMTYGLDQDRPVTSANFGHAERLAQRISAARSAGAPDRQDILYRGSPEKWLESMVRARPSSIDSALLPAPLYSQVPALAGSDKGIIDLLGSDGRGRLVVIEIKASEDIHLPLQGLDYWIHVKWHLDRGEFQKRGYFPGLVVQPAPPRLLLVSPAFDFHPTTETILQYFSPQVEVERIGLGAEWRSALQVIFRARGAERPGQ